MTQALDEIKIGGLGASRKRVEDSRFIRGKGNYTDDIVLPGMLHMSILRSPFAHARIRSIDTSRAAALPGVVAAHTELPVIGVPLRSSLSVLDGLDALLSIVQMPPGVPVATVGVDNAKNAAVLAARIIGTR